MSVKTNPEKRKRPPSTTSAGVQDLTQYVRESRTATFWMLVAPRRAGNRASLLAVSPASARSGPRTARRLRSPERRRAAGVPIRVRLPAHLLTGGLPVPHAGPREDRAPAPGPVANVQVVGEVDGPRRAIGHHRVWQLRQHRAGGDRLTAAGAARARGAQPDAARPSRSNTFPADWARAAMASQAIAMCPPASEGRPAAPVPRWLRRGRRTGCPGPGRRNQWYRAPKPARDGIGARPGVRLTPTRGALSGLCREFAKIRKRAVPGKQPCGRMKSAVARIPLRRAIRAGVSPGTSACLPALRESGWPRP